MGVAFLLHLTFFVAVVAFDNRLFAASVVFCAFSISFGKSVSSFEGLSSILSSSVVDHLDHQVVQVFRDHFQVLIVQFSEVGNLVLGAVSLIDQFQFHGMPDGFGERSQLFRHQGDFDGLINSQ